LLAGAKAVVSTLWEVPDGRVATLINLFYDNMLSGMSVASALCEAQRAFRRQFGDPYLWGALIAYGDASTTVEAPFVVAP
jgi:CHAT domain-containing protein